MESSRKTRSGRLVKEPQRYEPVEKVVDDYADDEHDPNVDLDASDDELEEELIGSDDDEEEESEDDEEDADEKGNLKDFVAYSEDDDGDSDYDEDEDDEEYEDSDDDEDEDDEYSEEDEEEETAADQGEKSVPAQ